jgi:hypothetical protein
VSLDKNFIRKLLAYMNDNPGWTIAGLITIAGFFVGIYLKKIKRLIPPSPRQQRIYQYVTRNFE